MSTYKDAWEKLLKRSVFPWWEWDIAGNIVKSNDLKVTMLSFDPADFRGKGFEAFTELIHPEDYDKAMDAMRLVLSGKTNLYQIDYRIKTADGSYLWFIDRGIVIERSEEGKPSVIRGVVIDLGKESSKNSDVRSLMTVFDRSSKITHGESSFISVCTICHKVKEDEAHWVKLSPDLNDLIAEKISHGMCPSCLRKLYPDIADQIIRGMESALWAV